MTAGTIFEGTRKPLRLWFQAMWYVTNRAALGGELVDSYVKLKLEEWRRYATTLTDWEREHTLDC